MTNKLNIMTSDLNEVNEFLKAYPMPDDFEWDPNVSDTFYKDGVRLVFYWSKADGQIGVLKHDQVEESIRKKFQEHKLDVRLKAYPLIPEFMKKCMEFADSIIGSADLDETHDKITDIINGGNR